MAKKITGIIFVALIVALGYWYRHEIRDIFREDKRSTNLIEVKLLLRETPDPVSLANILEEKGIVPSKNLVLQYFKKHDLNQAKLSAGKYIILPQTQMKDLVEGFIDYGNGHGKAELKVNVIFNNCRDIYDVASNISKCILADSASIVDYLLKPETMSSLGLKEEELPSLFLPRRYQMYFDTDAAGFVDFMSEKHKEFWNETRLQKLKAVGLKTPSEAATLASIIYSEQSRSGEEWPVIARLYLNRLDKGMKLESDPTFRFCWGHELDGVEQLLNKHKNIDCLYNTYLYEGLPPGPIFVVPSVVIDAVLNPDENDYIFMMAKPGGEGHNFASTNAEHHKNVLAYRKWLKDYLKNKQQ